MNKKKISRTGEVALLKLFQKWLAADEDIPDFQMSKLKMAVGIGDDCAAIQIDSSSLLLASTDSLVEGVHFRNEYFSPEELGYKALAVNISDIAAMGGIPAYALVALALSESTELIYIEKLYKGLSEAAQDFGVKIIGGDTVKSLKPLIISITLLGIVEKECIVKRKGAQAGDKIFVTGNLGDAMLGLEIMEDMCKSGEKRITREDISEDAAKVCAHFLRPCPRVKEGRILAENRLATSMIDLSDSFSQDIDQLCRASGVGAQIKKQAIPISSELQRLSTKFKTDPYHYALSGGEEYELLFTVKPENSEKTKDLISRNICTKITEIGKILAIQEGISIMDESGEIRPLPPTGYEHFTLWNSLT